jgi:hypothetical protein
VTGELQGLEVILGKTSEKNEEIAIDRMWVVVSRLQKTLSMAVSFLSAALGEKPVFDRLAVS